MKLSKNYIYMASIFLLPFSLFIGLGNTILANTAGSDVWISVILGTIFGIGINYLLTILPAKDSKITGLISNLVLLTLGLIIIIKLISSVYLDKTSSLLIMIPFMLLIFYTALKNDYTLYKVTSILNYIYILFFIFAFASLIPEVKLDYFKPTMINPLINIFKGSLEYALYSTLPLIVIPNLKEKYNYKIYLLSSLFMLIIFILLVGNLGLDLAQNYRYPEYMLFKNIAILDFIENIENILFFVWIVNIYTLTSHTCLNIKKIIGSKGLIISLILIGIIINIFLINNYLSLEFLLDNFDYILLSVLVIYIIGKFIRKNHIET